MSNKLTPYESGWGGSRPGSGRKPVEEKRKPYAFRLTQAEHQQVKEYIKKMKEDKKMTMKDRGWEIVKIEDGLAVYKKGDTKIKIEHADTTGCYELKKYESGKLTGQAFWHGEDMKIPEDIDDIWTEYFGKPVFLPALDWVEWEEAE